jgi:hypothetical protein
MIVLLTSMGALLVASVAFAHTPVAHAASTCGVGNGTGYGYTYLTTLKVTRTSCSTGKNVARHHGHVRGWHCTRKTLNSSPTQVEAKETCKSGSKSVVWTYSQNR